MVHLVCLTLFQNTVTKKAQPPAKPVVAKKAKKDSSSSDSSESESDDSDVSCFIPINRVLLFEDGC